MELSASQFMAVVAAVSFLALFFMCVGMVQYIRQTSRRREIVKKITLSGGGALYGATPASAGKESAGEGLFINFLRALGKRVMPSASEDYSRIKLKFLRAGIRRENVAAIFWGAKLVLALGLPLAFLAARLTVLKLTDVPLTVALEAMSALAGYYLPDFWLRVKTEQRQEKIEKALPDALDLMVICVEAGMGMDAAINRVAGEIELASPELSGELSLLNLELRAGKARRDALKNIALRTNIEAVSSLATTLIQTDKFGTSISAALSVFSDGFRTRRFQKAEEMAGKLPVKLMIPLIFFIFPALFVVIAGPAAILIYQNLILR